MKAAHSKSITLRAFPMLVLPTTLTQPYV